MYSVKSFKQFYIDTKGSLFAYLIRMTGDYQLSKDIMQESFSRLLGHYGSENPNKSLLFTIARNVFHDMVRKNRGDTEFEEDRWQGSGNPESDILIKESFQRVLAAMQQLNSSDREILALVVSSDMTYQGIAEILHTSEGNVKVKVHRARVKLRELLQQEVA